MHPLARHESVFRKRQIRVSGSPALCLDSLSVSLSLFFHIFLHYLRIGFSCHLSRSFETLSLSLSLSIILAAAAALCFRASLRVRNHASQPQLWEVNSSNGTTASSSSCTSSSACKSRTSSSTTSIKWKWFHDGRTCKHYCPRCGLWNWKCCCSPGC